MFGHTFDSITGIDETGFIMSLPHARKGGSLLMHSIVPEVFGAGDTVEIYEIDSLAQACFTLTFTGVQADTETLTILVDDQFRVEDQLGSGTGAGLVFEFDNTGAYTAGRRRIQIGATAAECAQNTAKAILAANLDGILPVRVWLDDTGLVVYVKNLVPGVVALAADAAANLASAQVYAGVDPPAAIVPLFAAVLTGDPIPLELVNANGIFIRTVDADANNPLVTLLYKHSGNCPRLSGKGVSGMNSSVPSFA